MKKDKDKRGQIPVKGKEGLARAAKGKKEQATGSSREPTPIYLTSNSTLQTPEEHERDQGVDPAKDDTMDVSDSDLQDIKAGRLTGREPGSNAPGE